MSLKEVLNSNRPAESRQLACALTFCGGFIDAYTYIQRGHTLSAGQTGNVIFFSSALADHNVPGMINRASTFIAFSLGLLLVGLFHKYVKSHYWRVFCLFPILAICIVKVFLIIILCLLLRLDRLFKTHLSAKLKAWVITMHLQLEI